MTILQPLRLEEAIAGGRRAPDLNTWTGPVSFNPGICWCIPHMQKMNREEHACIALVMKCRYASYPSVAHLPIMTQTVLLRLSEIRFPSQIDMQQ
jgi:hypothetical protein